MTDKLLTQDEIDSLLKGISSGEIGDMLETKKETKPKASRAAAAAGGPDAQNYDFTHHERSVVGKFPGMERAMERFSRAFRTTLSNSLRAVADINVSSLKVGNFGEFMSKLPLPSSIHVFRLDPLKGNGLVVLETNLVFALVDIFFGGSGKPSMKIEGREFTTIESRIIQRVVFMLLEDLERSFGDVSKVKAHYQRSEMNPQFAKICHDNEPVFVIQNVMDLDQHSGKMFFCFPQALFDPIRDRLKVQMDEEMGSDDKWKPAMQREMQHVAVDVRVELGHAHTTARELLSLKVGDIVELDRMHNEELTILVGGIPKMKGVPGVFRGNLAVKVSKLIEEEKKTNGG